MFYQWLLSSYISLTYNFLNLKIDLVALGVLLWTTSRLQIQQVCIPVGCVPPPSVATVNRITNSCENITFPQTSFAGGNEVNLALEAMYIASALLHGS